MKKIQKYSKNANKDIKKSSTTFKKRNIGNHHGEIKLLDGKEKHISDDLMKESFGNAEHTKSLKKSIFTRNSNRKHTNKIECEDKSNACVGGDNYKRQSKERDNQFHKNADSVELGNNKATFGKENDVSNRDLSKESDRDVSYKLKQGKELSSLVKKTVKHTNIKKKRYKIKSFNNENPVKFRAVKGKTYQRKNYKESGYTRDMLWSSIFVTLVAKKYRDCFKFCVNRKN